MKAIYYITVATVLFFTGCEFFSNNQELMNPPEFEYLIQDLDNELNLDTEQRSSDALGACSRLTTIIDAGAKRSTSFQKPANRFTNTHRRE